jgi:Uma2 family endonuclease
MGLPVEKRRYTVEEYLRMERVAQERHEYHDGEVLAMAGGSVEHSLIVSNFNRVLGNALVGNRCRVYDSNLKVSIARTRSFVYPDISVICGQPQFDPSDPAHQTVTNPRVIVEVLSPSTELYDRGVKFTQYRELESFEEYVLISQYQPFAETFFRQPDGTWLFTPYAGLESVLKVRYLGVELRLADVYAGVEFPVSPDVDLDPFAAAENVE